MTTRRHRTLAVLPLAVLLAAGACQEVTVPNYNNASIEQLTGSPTPSVVTASTIGMLINWRGRVATETWAMGILGRENYNLDQAEPRNVIAYLAGPIEPGGFVQDMGWTNGYRNIRQGLTILEAIEKVGDWTAPQKESMRGLVKTIIAAELLTQIRIRDTLGIVLDIGADAAAPLGPIVGKDAALTGISALLDEAKTHLNAGGAAFPFALHSGFTGFTTPSTFLRVNRALKARVSVYRRQWQQVLTDLGESFIDVSSGSATTLQRGAYHVFSTNPGDVVNPLFDPTPTRIYVHPSILSGAQLRADGSPDLRLSGKTAPGVERVSATVRGTHRFTHYPTGASSVPIIKNEELILLRAEANWQLGNRAAALTDLNFIRVNSGGLAALPADFSGDFIGELLYNRTYSLLLENGHRWVDARRFGRLAQLPKSNAATLNEKIFPYVMLPVEECSQRTPKPEPACSEVKGL